VCSGSTRSCDALPANFSPDSSDILLITAEPESVLGLQPQLPELRLAVESSPGPAALRLREQRWNLVLLDALMPEALLLHVLEHGASQGIRVVALTRSSLPVAARLLSRGVADLIPFPPRAEDVRQVLRQSPAVASLPRVHTSADMPIGGSPPMLEALKTTVRVAPSRATVLLQGESGTGKELFARLLHEYGPRALRAFVAINCAAIPDALLESELFGHERGAFTGAAGRRIGRFERAAGGTLFLDEICDMSLGLQAKILRALQEREIERVGGDRPIPVDVRVVAATNRDPRQEVAAGRFREDLYFRLAVVRIVLPPLRERGSDVRALAELFVAAFAQQYGRPTLGLSEEVLAVLERYAWPGNVREMRNAIEHAVLMADGPVLLRHHLPEDIARGGVRPSGSGVPISYTTFDLLPLREAERRCIHAALDSTGGQLARAAEILGIHRNTLRRKLQELVGNSEGLSLLDSSGSADQRPPLDPSPDN
jgi:DNA-binding NtrC family response regulator